MHIILITAIQAVFPSSFAYVFLLEAICPALSIIYGIGLDVYTFFENGFFIKFPCFSFQNYLKLVIFPRTLTLVPDSLDST